MSKWSHYIGGKYTEASFIEEASEQGISRRISAREAQKMSYGDVVACLSWRNGEPVVFAEFTVSQLFLPDDISFTLTAQLYEEGCVLDSSGGGGAIDRKCGSYQQGCTHYVSNGIDLPELVSRANAIFAEAGQKPWYMVGGELNQVFSPPKSDATTPFFRGFRRATGYARFDTAHTCNDCNVSISGVIDYQRE